MDDNQFQLFKKRVEDLAARFEGEVVESYGDLVLTIKATHIIPVLTAVKSLQDFPCDFLHDLGGVDLKDQFQVVYHLTSLHGPQKLRVKAIVDRVNPVINSATSLWLGANFLEREAYDMFGIKFDGHPNLKRIYMWDGFEGFPLRKDYVTEPVEVRNKVRVRRNDD